MANDTTPDIETIEVIEVLDNGAFITAIGIGIVVGLGLVFAYREWQRMNESEDLPEYIPMQIDEQPQALGN